MSVQVIWNIRDARNLNHEEKGFLFVVASRGVMSSRWDTAAADMGMTKQRYYKARSSLLEKGLLEEGRRMNGTTVYRIKEDVLATYVPEKVETEEITWDDSHMETDHSHIGNGDSLVGNDDSRIGETKVTKKVTSKETIKETSKDSASATSYELKECKEQGEVTENVDQSSLASSKNTPGPSLEVVKEDAPNDLEGKGAAATEYDEWALDLIRKSEYAEEALKLFLDPTWEEKLDPLRRANLAVIRVTPVREPAQAKEAATETIEWDW